MLWMIRWAGSFPVFVKEAKGAHFVDVDGKDYIDFCLGDTGAMTGHAPEATLAAHPATSREGHHPHAALSKMLSWLARNFSAVSVCRIGNSP